MLTRKYNFISPTHKNNYGLKARGTNFYLNNQLFRNMGVNHFSLVLREFVTFGTMTNPGPDADFISMKNYGIKIVRAAFGWYDRLSWLKYYYNNKTAWWAACETVIRSAEKHNIGLICNLAWNTKAFAECAYDVSRATLGPRGLAYEGTTEYELMRSYIAEFCRRFGNSSAIYAWEFDNEWSAKSGNEWYPTWKIDGTDPVAGVNANWDTKPNGDTYVASDKMLFTDYTRYCRNVVNLFAQYDPYGRIVISGNAIGNSYAVKAQTTNTLRADTKAEWDGTGATGGIPWIAYREKEFPVVCQHVYPGAQDSVGTFFSDQKLNYAQHIAYAKKCADIVGKPFILEEWGSTKYGSSADPETLTTLQEQTNFNNGLQAIKDNNIQIALLWNWDGQLVGGLEWQKWKLTDATRSYQLDAIGAHNEIYN